MHYKNRILTTFFLSMSAMMTMNVSAADKLLPAFPGAEGFGAIAKGGRGGRVIKVKNLNAQGPGSLQAACSRQGPRIIVFDVSGVITGDIVIKYGNVTIAGQTAPSAGITIAGTLASDYSSKVPIDDIIIRHLRVRPLNARGNSGDAIQFSKSRRLILDHVSCSWACDETIDIYSGRDITIQWCTVSESRITGHPKGVHNYGLISGPQGERVTIHHTLFAHHRRRCPAIANGPADIRNLVVYNFRDGLSHEGHIPNGKGFNLIGNYYKAGPSDKRIFPFCFYGNVSYYLHDNFIEGVGIVDDPWSESDKLPGLKYYASKGRRALNKVEVPAVKTHRPRLAYELVLKRAGCFPRDAITHRIVKETRNGTGSWGRPASFDRRELTTGLHPTAALVDTDEDGIPDQWERAHGLNPLSPADSTQFVKANNSTANRHFRYTNIEYYINDRADKLVGNN